MNLDITPISIYTDAIALPLSDLESLPNREV